MIKMTQEERLVRSKIQLLMEYPFFGQLAMYLELVENNSIPTAATNGKKYFYNNEFVGKLTDEELNFLTAHETLHPALGHLWRSEGKDKVIFNHAADYVINAMILECDPQQRNFKLIKDCLYDKKYEGMSTEEVYDLLIKDANYVKKAHDNAMSNNQGTVDSHDMWGDGDADESGGTGGAGQEDWQGRVVQAAQATEGVEKGKMPALFKRILKNLTSPQKNWKQLLAEFVQQEISDYGFTPPDKRFAHMDVLLPDFSETEDVIKNLVFAVDTSGSIGEKEFAVFLSEIIGCMNQFGGKVRGTLIYCDSNISPTGVYDLEDAKQSLPEGGGGTSFIPVFNWIKDNLNDECAGLIYLTDGEGDYPQKLPQYPVLWVLTQEYSTPFGIKTRIKI
jgi:predicted metal-dependent peptidase